MKTNEVRVGNWVLIPTNNEIKIPVYPKQIKGITLFGGFEVAEPTDPEGWLVPAKHCAGIPITGEWLERIGFKQISDIMWGCDYILVYDSSDHSVCYGGQWLSKVFIHVHELQNLYFTLTGEELLWNLQ